MRDIIQTYIRQKNSPSMWALAPELLNSIREVAAWNFCRRTTFMSIFVAFPIHIFLRVKRQGREADHSPLASAEVNKMWIYTSTTPYAFMA
jgi:hypothetical protein